MNKEVQTDLPGFLWRILSHRLMLINYYTYLLLAILTLGQMAEKVLIIQRGD